MLGTVVNETKFSSRLDRKNPILSLLRSAAPKIPRSVKLQSKRKHVVLVWLSHPQLEKLWPWYPSETGKGIEFVQEAILRDPIHVTLITVYCYNCSVCIGYCFHLLLCFIYKLNFTIGMYRRKKHSICRLLCFL